MYLERRPADVRAAADLRWLAGGFFSYIGVGGVNIGWLSGGQPQGWDLCWCFDFSSFRIIVDCGEANSLGPPVYSLIFLC